MENRIKNEVAAMPLELESLAKMRRFQLAQLPPSRRFRHKKTGRVFIVRDVVFLHAAGGTLPAYEYAEVTVGGDEVTFVRLMAAFLEKFEVVE